MRSWYQVIAPWWVLCPARVNGKWCRGSRALPSRGLFFALGNRMIYCSKFSQFDSVWPWKPSMFLNGFTMIFPYLAGLMSIYWGVNHQILGHTWAYLVSDTNRWLRPPICLNSFSECSWSTRVGWGLSNLQYGTTFPQQTLKLQARIIPIDHRVWW